MDSISSFDIAGGSVAGTAHLRAGRNAQDAFAIASRDAITVAVVTDGCGGSAHSEVGAKLGARIVVREILARVPATPAEWRDTAAAIVTRLRRVATSVGPDLESVVNDYLLFTIVGALITPEETTVFAAGDGCFAVNGELQILGPYPGNAPPYLGYAIADGTLPALTLCRQLPTLHVRTLLLGSDGAERLRDQLEPFWTDDVVFNNPDAIRRRLFLLTRPKTPLLDDDTTLVVLRRRP